MAEHAGVFARYDDVWLVDGARTPFVDYNGPLGQVGFKEFPWQALLDPAPAATMGDTAENLAKRYRITRDEVDRFAAESFARAAAAQADGFLAGEIAPLATETFELAGYRPRGIRIPSRSAPLDADTLVRQSSIEALGQIRPAFGGVQTGGNSSAIVDGGAAAALVASGGYVRAAGRRALARVLGGVAVGVPPDVMGIGRVPAIRQLLARPAERRRQRDRDRASARRDRGALTGPPWSPARPCRAVRPRRRAASPCARRRSMRSRWRAAAPTRPPSGVACVRARPRARSGSRRPPRRRRR